MNDIHTVEEWLGKDNKLGQDIWHKKYQKNEETFDAWLDRVSLGNPAYRRLIELKMLIPGGRILSNVGIDDDSCGMSNCYSRGFIEDDYGDIMQAAVDIGKTFKAQGGEGLSLSKLRPKGTPIGDKYESDGIIPFMRIYNEVTQGTSQGGARKGALLMSLDAWHKEAMNFITIKSEEGLIEKANLSLEIDNEFMECVQAYYERGETKTITRKESYSGHEIEWEVTPIEVFKAFIHNNYEWGDPGCLFVDKFRNYNLMEFCDNYQIETCNPSLRAGTEVLTDKGPFPIEALEGKFFYVVNVDGESAPAECFLSGKNKQLYKITLENNEEIYCTPEHKWPIATGKAYQKKSTNELTTEDKFLISKNTILSKGSLGSYEDGMFLGYWYGDGSVTELKDGGYQYGFTFGHGDKIDFWLPFISKYLSNITGKTYCGTKRNRGGQDWVELAVRDASIRDLFKKYGIESKNKFPSTLLNECSEEFRRGFIDGLLSADGCVNTTHKGEAISLTTASETIARQFYSMLYWYGLKPNIQKLTRTIDLGNGEKEYTRYDICLSKGKFERFVSMFKLSSSSKYNKILDIIKTSKRNNIRNETIAIKSIELTDICEDVWDIHVYDNTHTFSLNWCITGNCGEQPLPKHGACNLAAINLSEFVISPYTNEAGFDFDAFEEAVTLGIQYLDKIVDFNANRHALPQQKKMALEFRNCGLGVMGYATMLMKLGMQYGSDDAIRFSNDLFSYMFITAVRSSSKEAKKLGTFPGYRDQIFNSNIILNHFGNGAISDLRSIGLRNCSLLSIAPTGSIATMLGESGGIEPEFAISYTRRTVGLTDNEDHYYTVYCKAAREYLAAHPECDGVLPDWFVSSADIDPIRRVKTQAVIQKHIDTAISSTVNLPEAASEDDMARIYIEAWKQGTKGLTIFRSGCKREAILTTGDTAPKKNEQKNDTCTDCLNRGMIIGVDDDLMSIKKTIINGCGKFYLHVDFDETSLEFLETYIDIGSGGGCERNLQFISRLMSLALRAGVPLEAIIDQAYSIRPCNAYLARTKSKGDTSPGTSCPSAIGKALEEMKKKAVYLYGDDTEEAPEVVSDPTAKKANNTKTNHNDSPSKCPECGAQLRFEGGCDVCPECGYSHCG